jgi:hypothetical protein
MALVSTFFQMFMVFGLYNLALNLNNCNYFELHLEWAPVNSGLQQQRNLSRILFPEKGREHLFPFKNQHWKRKFVKMMHLIGDIAKYFKFDEVNIDNWVFKLYYKGCFILFLMGSMVGILSQYFGEPINCDFKGIDSEMASDYCWIHGSSYMPKRYQPHMK